MHDPFYPSSILFTQLFFHYQDFKTLHDRYFRPQINLIPLKNHKTHLHQLNQIKSPHILPTFLSSNISPLSPSIHPIPSFKIQQNSYTNVFFSISNFPHTHHILGPQHSFLLLSKWKFLLCFPIFQSLYYHLVQ